MHPEIEKLIEMALADGIVTDKEREIILRKAEKLGLDMDEVEMYLEGKIGVSSIPVILTHDLQEDLNEVTIGNQIWKSKNLNVDKFRNGDPIPYAKYDEDWIEANYNKTPVCGYYDNNPNNESKFGKIYNYYALIDKRGLAPEGWKIPSTQDWKNLIQNLGGDDVAGDKMKSKSENWNNFGFGENSSGFSVEPGGWCDVGRPIRTYDKATLEWLTEKGHKFGANFEYNGEIASYFSSSIINNDESFFVEYCLLKNDSRKAEIWNTFSNIAMYVRCMKN